MRDPLSLAFTPEVEEVIATFEKQINHLTSESSIKMISAMPDGSHMAAIMAIQTTMAYVAMVSAIHMAIGPMLMNGMRREDIEKILDETFREAKAMAFEEGDQVIAKVMPKQ